MYMQGNKQLEAVASIFSKESVIGEQSVISDSAVPALMILALTKHKEFEATWSISHTIIIKKNLITE